MAQIEFIQNNEKAFECYDAFQNGTRKLAPVFFERNEKKYFVINYDITNKYSEEKSKEKANTYRTQLEANNGRYFCFDGKPDVWAFLKFVKSKGYNFEYFTKFSYHNGFYEFDGNLREVSFTFHYRIYDRRLFARLRKHLPDIQVKDYTKEN